MDYINWLVYKLKILKLNPILNILKKVFVTVLCDDALPNIYKEKKWTSEQF